MGGIFVLRTTCKIRRPYPKKSCPEDEVPYELFFRFDGSSFTEDLFPRVHWFLHSMSPSFFRVRVGDSPRSRRTTGDWWKSDVDSGR